MTSRAPVLVLLMFFGCSKSAPDQPTPNEGRAERGSRKIAREGQLRLIVADLDALDLQLQQQLSRQGGLVASTDRGDAVARWTLRVPSDHFEQTIAALSSLGAVAALHTEARDVTADFTDTEARLIAKQTEEARLLRLLETGQGGIQDVLAVEKELARVRTEAEELTRHSKQVSAQVAMATLDVTATQGAALFGKPAPLTGELASAFAASCGALAATARGLAIGVAAVTPWLLALSAVLTPLVIRRRRPR